MSAHNDYFKKKLLTNLTLAQTSKVCFKGIRVCDVGCIHKLEFPILSTTIYIPNGPSDGRYSQTLIDPTFQKVENQFLVKSTLTLNPVGKIDTNNIFVELSVLLTC